jgi:hypothetical protein
MQQCFARQVEARVLPTTSQSVVGYFAAEEGELKFHPLDPRQSPAIKCTSKMQAEPQFLLRCLQMQNRGDGPQYVYPGRWKRVESRGDRVILLFQASTTQFLSRKTLSIPQQKHCEADGAQH